MTTPPIGRSLQRGDDWDLKSGDILRHIRTKVQVTLDVCSCFNGRNTIYVIYAHQKRAVVRDIRDYEFVSRPSHAR